MALAQQRQLRAYTLEDGLSQSQVYDMVQDSMGYVWLGTQGGGLCRFDGENFKVFKEKEGLLSNYVHALFVTGDSLFIGTKKGLSIKTKNTFLNKATPQVNRILSLGNTTYLLTQKGIFSYGNGSLRQLKLHTEIDGNSVSDLIFDGTSFWIATNKALWQTTSLEPNTADLKSYENNDFKSLVQSKNTLFAATYHDGILVIDLMKKEADFVLKEPLRINSLSLHNTNELWVATDNDGLTIIDLEKYTEKYKIDKRLRLGVLHIRKTMVDRQGNIWIATSGGGFYKYFENSFRHYDRDTGLRDNRVYAVHAVENTIWISNAESGLMTIDSSGIRHISKVPQATGVKIKTITSDALGNIWAGTDGRGILYRETTAADSMVINSIDQNNIRIDTIRTRVTKNYHIDTDKGLLSDWISSLHVQGDAVWAASYSSGLLKFRFDRTKDSIETIRKFGKEEGIQDPYIRDIKEDFQGRLWYSTQHGYLGYIEKGKVTDLGQVLDQNIGIGTLLFHKNKMYLGTSGNGIWWTTLDDPTNFTKLSSSKYSYSNTIYQLIFDNNGRLWVGTERGVDNLLLDQENNILDIFHYGRDDGFLGIETCLNAVDKDAKGNLWFGALYGLTEYRGEGTVLGSSRPQLYFDRVEVGYKAIDSIDYRSWTNSDKVLFLRPDQTQLSFGYTSVDINHPKAIQYRFKLNEDNWSPWSEVNRQNFAGLASGQHTFTAQSRNYRWEESSPIRFQFFIDRPLYQKTWFQWAIFTLIALILAYLGFSYVRKVKRRNAVVQERLEMENHLLSLEQKALRLQMNPHFIFNVLNGIKALGTNNRDKMNHTINSFASLLRETLYNSRKDVISLDQEIKALKHYIEVEQLMAAESFAYDLIVNTAEDPEELLIPPMLIQPFVENAIRHGILKGNSKGHLEVVFSTDDSFLHVSITDNGIGIYESQKQKNTTDHQSMALKVTEERLLSISGKGALQIEELKNPDQSISGTRIRFKIPLETDY